MRLHTERLPDAFVAALCLPRPLVENTVRRMKEGGRIPRGFRHAPPLSARDVARIVLGLSAMSPTGAVAHEKATGALRLTGGAGATTAEAELTATIATLARPGAPSGGFLRIGITTPLVALDGATTRFYGRRGHPAAAAYFETPIAALAQLVRAIEIE